MKRNQNKVWKVLIILLSIAMVVGGLLTLTVSSSEKEKTVTVQNPADMQGNTVENTGRPGQENSGTSQIPSQTQAAVSTQEPTIEPTETPKPVKIATLVAVGDDLIHSPIYKSARQSGGAYNFDTLFKHIKKEVSGADLAVINQETILGGASLGYSGYPRFNSPTEVGDAIVKAGFDVVLHATNHAMDKGEKGLQNTLEFWKKYPKITVLGVNETKEDAEEINVVEVNGIRIAMLNYTYGLNGLPLPKKRPYMVNLLEEDKVRSDVAKAKECSDFIIVFPHWGNEYILQPVDSQKKWSQLFAELGVDLVIGAHPHVIEPVEWVEADNGHKMLVYYSLGNFVSSQTEVPRMLGAMAGITIEKVGEEKAVIREASITPLVTHIAKGSRSYTVYKLSEYTNKLASSHKLSSKGLTVKKLKSLSKQVLGTWYTE